MNDAPHTSLLQGKVGASASASNVCSLLSWRSRSLVFSGLVALGGISLGNLGSNEKLTGWAAWWLGAGRTAGVG